MTQFWRSNNIPFSGTWAGAGDTNEKSRGGPNWGK